jgi:hypothetical protein
MSQSLRAQLAALRLKRPEPAKKFQDMTLADYAAWERTHAAWMNEVERLTALITVAECPVELSKCHLLANPAFPVPSPRFRQ